RRRFVDGVPAPRPLRALRRRRIGARRHPGPRQGVAGPRRPRRHHRQPRRRPRHARDHEHLRSLPAPDDVRDPVVGLPRPTGEQVPAPLQWGAFAPQGWKLEYTGWSAADAWARTKELARLTEKLGYEHLWVYDHVETVPRREPTHMFEAFTTLAALAQHTS